MIAQAEKATRERGLFWWLAAAALAALLTAAVAGAQPATVAKHDVAARSYFTDVALINQDGEEVRLYSDLLQGRIVVIGAMFTDCEGVCPVTMGNFKKIQDWLGPRLGQDVHHAADGVVDRLHLSVEQVRGPSAFGARGHLITNPDVGESPSSHHPVVSAT